MAIDVMVVRNLRWILPLLKPVKEVRGGTLESRSLSNPDELNVVASGRTSIQRAFALIESRAISRHFSFMILKFGLVHLLCLSVISYLDVSLV